MATSSKKPLLDSSFTPKKNLKRASILTALLLIVFTPRISSPTYSQSSAAEILVFSGYPSQLPADGESTTVLEVRIDNCRFGVPIESSGTFSLDAHTSDGSIEFLRGDFRQQPAQLLLTSSTQPGVALIDVTVSYCPPGGVVLLGVCSDPSSVNATCSGSTSFTFIETENTAQNTGQTDTPVTSPPAADSQFQASAENEGSQEMSLAELYQDLEEFLAGEDIDAPTPGQMAASGIALTTLLAGWLVLNQMSGVSAEKSLEVIKVWRDGKMPPIGAEAELSTDFWESGAEGSLPDEDPEPGEEEDPEAHDRPPMQEGSEDRLLRGVKDAQDIDDALKETNKDIEAFEGKIPDQVKNLKAWKKHVEPKLKQAKDLLKKGELDKARTWLDRAEKILEVRKDVDRDLDHLPVEQREGVVRLVQALKVGGHLLSDGFNAMVLEPAKAAGNKLLPPELAQRWEKAMDETGQAMSDVGQGVPKAVQKVSREITHGEMMEQAEQMSQDSSPEIRKEGQQMKDLYKRDNVDHFDPWGKGTKKAKEIWNHTMRALFHDR